MNSKLLRKLCAVSLSVLMLTGAGVAEIGSFIGTSLPVSAATAETPASDFGYWQSDDGSVSVNDYKGSETEIVIPEYIDGHRVTAISDYAFYNCSNLTSVTIPQGVTEIGNGAFKRCTSLKVLNMPNDLLKMGESVFFECSSLAAIVIPDSVKTIEKNAFASCTSLKSVTLPSGLTCLESGLFWNCRALSFITIPDSVREIKGLTYKEYENDRGYKIYRGVFEDCTNLTSVKLPNSVQTVGSNAFYNCQNLRFVKLSKNLKRIETGAFAKCSQLKSIEIPESVSYIGGGYPMAISDCYYYEYEILNRCGAFEECSNLESIVIPDNVSVIGENAFAHCKKLKTAKLSAKLDTLDHGIFWDCTSLTDVVIPNGVKKMKGDSIIPSWKIFDMADDDWYQHTPFDGCTSLEYLAMPDSMTEIEENALANCSSLKNVKLSAGLEYLNYGLFKNCTGLTELVIPEGVKGIKGAETTTEYDYDYDDEYEVYHDGAFKGCSNLNKLVVPESVTTIGDDAFEGCESLALYAKTGGVAERYAEDNQIPFVPVKILKNRSTVSAKAILKGQSVTVNCAGGDGVEPYEYAVWYQNPNNKKWYKAQGYSTKSTVTVKPKQTGAYIIRVNVKDARGKIAKKDFTVNVFAALKNTSSVSTTSLTLGRSVTVNAASTGGLGTKQYSVWYQNPNNKKWYKSQDYSDNTTVTVKPKQTGAYIVRVKVKDEREKVVTKYLNVTVTK